MLDSYNDDDIIEEAGLMHFYRNVETEDPIKNNNYKMFNLSLNNVKSAIISALITGALGIASYIIGIGDVFKIDSHTLINIGSISALTAIVSILKAYLTTDSGKFMGAVEIH